MMTKPAVQPSIQAPSVLLLPSRNGTLRTLPISRPSSSSVTRQQRSRRNGRIQCSVSEESPSLQATVTKQQQQPTTVKAVVTVKQTVGGRFAHLLEGGLDLAGDAIQDLLGKSILLELVSTELDPKTGKVKKTVQAFAHKAGSKGLDVSYEAIFTVPKDFGEIGAILVTNEHHKEMYLGEVILMTGDVVTDQTIHCRSWVHSKFDNPAKRVFFTSKCFLPSQTPEGLRRLREVELETMRGDGTGERKSHERIYDYATYNDLGDPDNDEDTARPVLGGNEQFPYPRRCRTGRQRTKKDRNSETRSNDFYVPRDETFSEIKQATFSAKTVRSLLKALVPSIQTAIVDKNLGFPYFTAIDSLFNEGVPLPPQDGVSFFRTVIPRLVKELEETVEHVLLFETPEMIDRDKFSWFRDEEFTRQTLAGLNPLSIQLIREFPLVSKLDPKIYGPPESVITKELIEKEIRGVMTVEEALKENRLFILDYHDLFLPYVHKVRELEGSTFYGSRTVFFLTPSNVLRPIAIELTRPASPTKPQWKKAFSPCWDATGAWLWKLAKVHVLAHDSGYHQLVSHWLRTHACTEPYIIAANRQLSAMHPIYRLLHPHFRYTMEINALARESLINAGGVIETAFAPGKYSIELSAVAYGQLWQFDTEALPADLIKRGMALEDPTAEHGLKLTVKDYPYANDGLLIWSSIKQWVSDYVSHYYPNAASVAADSELQAFWTDVRTKGHADKKDEPWWPSLDSTENLTHILTTIIWVVSGHHAAVNFGQYHYAGYFPNRPTTARTNMPVEDEGGVEFARFLKKPESTLLECYPSQMQATVVMAVLDVLSTHAVDEEYLGQDPEPAWNDEPVIRAAFERFNGRMNEIEGIIDARNLDPELRNRCGAGIVPYELLKPYSESGVTGKGVPNSISI